MKKIAYILTLVVLIICVPEGFSYAYTCSSTHYNCTSGTSFWGTAYSTYYAWWCGNGAPNDGTDVLCREDKIAAVCASTHWSCTTGTNYTPYNTNNTNSYDWWCYSPNGGTNALCSEAKIPAVCASTHWNCTTGTNRVSYNTINTNSYDWWCDSTNGGTNALCTEAKIPAVCSSTHYNCTTGTNRTSYNTDNTNSYDWWCDSTNGGTNALCSEAKNQVPVGNIDSISCSGGVISISGYAYDPDALATAIGVNLKEGTTSLGSLTAGQIHTSGFHGFSGTISNMTSGSHTISVYAVDYNNNAVTTQFSASVTCASTPAISSFTVNNATLPAGGGSVTFSWASQNTTSCTITGGGRNDTGLSASGSRTISGVTTNTTFNLVCQ